MTAINYAIIGYIALGFVAGWIAHAYATTIAASRSEAKASREDERTRKIMKMVKKKYMKGDYETTKRND